jgi:hypothetical protein
MRSMHIHRAPLLTQIVGARQLGALTLEQRRALDRMLGKDAMARVLSRLPAELREEFETLTAFSWCRCTTLNLVLAEAAREAGVSEDAFVRDVVRESFGVVLRTVWRLYARFSSTESVVTRASKLYARAIDKGVAEAHALNPRHLVMEVRERPDLTHIDVVSIGAAVEAALELSGRRVRVTHRAIEHGVRYDVFVQRTLPPPVG